jgi:long-subunit acyl-CoA synthetase (AMP-forming)
LTVQFGFAALLILPGMKEVRPSYISGPPRFWEVIYQEYQRSLLAEVIASNNPEASKVKVIKIFNSILGDRIKLIVTGGAPTAPPVRAFMEVTNFYVTLFLNFFRSALHSAEL